MKTFFENSDVEGKNQKIKSLLENRILAYIIYQLLSIFRV